MDHFENALRKNIFLGKKHCIFWNDMSMVYHFIPTILNEKIIINKQFSTFQSYFEIIRISRTSPYGPNMDKTPRVFTGT